MKSNTVFFYIFSVRNNILFKIIKRQVHGNRDIFCPCDIIKLFNIQSNAILSEEESENRRSKWITIKFKKLLHKQKMFFENQLSRFFLDIETVKYCKLHNILFKKFAKSVYVGKTIWLTSPIYFTCLSRICSLDKFNWRETNNYRHIYF